MASKIGHWLSSLAGKFKMMGKGATKPQSALAAIANDASGEITAHASGEAAVTYAKPAALDGSVDRSHQFDKLKRTSRMIGGPVSSKQVWFGEPTSYDPQVVAGQAAAARKRPNARLNQASLTSTRLLALSESLEKPSEI